MSSNSKETPDLASILATLAGLAPQKIQQTQDQAPPQEIQQPQPTQQHHQQFPAASQPPLQQWRQPVPSHVQAGSITPLEAPVGRIIDPATIIDWSSGLKCVMRTVAKQESILNDIRHMIKSQQEHEQQWWNGRLDLLERQKTRIESQKKLNEVLKMVGGIGTGSSNTSPEELAHEIQTFDLKVYRAQVQMTKEFTSRLKSLGVPFFGTKTELVRIHKEFKDQASRDEKGSIDELYLVKLQKKMITLLEDMCGD
ncbi:hypothetical protein BJ878DRAFT_308362 [Calycina marina]|uniref:Uncharacterized protein n=1 Tax=Calycina marina TaxID=1763456 RepID=A0A9P8CIV6_9HELO|nr:hypothetical protein BJ878DRAFT_308362 [Calycina marina]